MKNFLMKAMVPCFILVFSIPAWPATIDYGTVGVLDDLFAEASVATVNSYGNGINGEAGWITDVLDIAPGTLVLDEYDTTSGDWLDVTGVTGVPSSNVYALLLNDSPSWFLLKLGQGQGMLQPGGSVYYLFENNANLNYATIWLGDLDLISITNVGGISHVAEVAPVPEPGTMMLLGSGLIGLAGWGRNRFRK